MKKHFLITVSETVTVSRKISILVETPQEYCTDEVEEFVEKNSKSFSLSEVEPVTTVENKIGKAHLIDKNNAPANSVRLIFPPL